MALQDELAELRGAIDSAARATDEESTTESRMAEVFKRLEPEAAPIRSPQAQWLEEMGETRSQFRARMEGLAEEVADARRDEVERDEAMLGALETVAAELEKASDREAQAAARESWMLRLTIGSVVFAAVAAATGALALFTA